MQRGVGVVAALVGAILWLAAAGVALAGASQRQPERVAALGSVRTSPGPLATTARRRPRRPGCGSACQNLGGVGGSFGGCLLRGPTPDGSANVDDASTLKIEGTTYTPKGDVLIAAIESAGATVSAPSGWTAAPQTDYTGAGERLQVFYRVAAQREPASYSFTSSAPQRMFGAIFDFFGVDPKHPIDVASGQVNATPSTAVAAPSITPSETETMLVFIGATSANRSWHAPSGMAGQDISTANTILASAPIGVATQRWHPAGSTGPRTATIASAGASIGELISLNYLRPLTCPEVRLLTHKFKSTSDGLLFVRVKCVWSATCKGAFEGVDLEEHFRVPKLAQSDFSVPAGKTRTIVVALTKAGLKALKLHRTLHFDVFIWVFAPAGQPVVAGGGAYKITI